MAWKRSVGRGASVAVAIVVALGIAELGASRVRGGAFPYLNAFVADAEYGVRLAPDVEARVRSRHGRITAVHTNSLGFRGPEWDLEPHHRVPLRSTPPAGARATRVLVLGDSQAMGLHVDWDDTFAARLASPTRVALDAAVPTWGPIEHLQMLEELAPRVAPTHVALVLTVGNDWHEANVPNTRRTTARDGWAMRPESAGTAPIEFPGRSFFLGRSHLVYAARQLAGRATGVAPLSGDEPHRLISDLEWLRRAPDGFHSRLGPTVRDARDVCARHGCELVVVVLPLDVQVHAAEWAKYRERPIDLRATEVLTADLLLDAAALGVTAIDLLPVLRAASPGAFLPDDPHLSARGHEAVARALEAAIARPDLEARR